MKELDLINPRDVSGEEVSGYKLREAARAIVFDEKGNIALLKVTRDGYYKLPGGGFEANEDVTAALKRECLEEIGCDIEVIRELGYTTEFWKEDLEKQISYCFLARAVGEKGVPALTESERERGYETVWLSYSQALEALRNSDKSYWEAEYIVPRELRFFEEVSEELG